MAEEIKLDENITIRDAFKITGREDKIGIIEKNMKKAGLSIDSPFSIFQDEDTSIKLAETVKGNIVLIVEVGPDWCNILFSSSGSLRAGYPIEWLRRWPCKLVIW